MLTSLRAPALVLVTVLVALPSSAAPAGYEQQYKTAVQLESTGKTKEALAAFEAIPAGARDWATRSHIATCLEKLGRLRAARATYEAILTEKKLAPAERESTESNLADVMTRIPRVRVTVASGSKDLAVTIDGEVVVPPATSEVDPGQHNILGTRAGKQVFTRKIDIAEGSTIDVVVDAPAVDAPAPATGPTTSAPMAPASEPTGSSSSAVGWILGGVGVASLGVGTVFLVRSIDQRDRRDEAAARGDVADALELTDRARSSLTIARIGLGVGLVATAVGGVLLLRPSDRAAALRVAPSVGAASYGLTLEGAW
jgi:hypothetical protein